jgi:hypothetical protein
MMTLADELMARRRWERSTILSTRGVVGHLSGTRSTAFSGHPGPVSTVLGTADEDVMRQVKTSYMSGMILTDWQTMKRTEMETFKKKNRKGSHLNKFQKSILQKCH